MSALTALLLTSIKSLTPSSTFTSSHYITGYLFCLLCCTFLPKTFSICWNQECISFRGWETRALWTGRYDNANSQMARMVKLPPVLSFGPHVNRWASQRQLRNTILYWHSNYLLPLAGPLPLSQVLQGIFKCKSHRARRQGSGFWLWLCHPGWLCGLRTGLTPCRKAKRPWDFFPL